MPSNEPMRSWSFRLDDDSENLEELLSKIIEESTVNTKLQTIELEQELAKVIVKRDSSLAKLQKRQAIQENIQKRLDRKNEDLIKAQNAYRKARSKTRHISHSLSSLTEQERNLKNSILQQKSVLDNFADVYTEDAFRNRAFMVMSVRHLVDESAEIKLVNAKDAKEMVLTWTTNDIYIRSPQGGNYPFNFGKFHVKVVFRYANGSRLVDTFITTAGGNKVLAREYAHPHIRSDGNPCLGNVSRMLLTHMANQDIAQVIYMITEYLCSYNERDPYRRLMYWGVANPQDLPQMHEIEQYLKFDDGPKRDCGLSESECFVQHSVDASGNCVHRGAPHRSLEIIKKREDALEKLKEVLRGESNNQAESSF